LVISDTFQEKKMIKKYRKKPLEVEAMHYKSFCIYQSILDWMHWHGCMSLINGNQQIIIPTLEGNHIASVGDYIIKGIAGEFYPCKPDIFEKSYDEIEYEI